MKTPPPALANIQAISPYVPGKPIEELQRELGIADVIKLASNENPLGMSPKAYSAVRAALSESFRYPDGNGFALKKKISAFFAEGKINVTPAQIVLGNGSNDLLDLAGRIYLHEGDRAVMSQYCFAVYPLVVQSVNARSVFVPTQNFAQDLNGLTQAIVAHKAKVVFLANPNNPTGVYAPSHEIKQWIESVPTSCAIVLDEAYTEFLPTDDFRTANVSTTWLDEHPNLIITRTFSKIYGLGGMRVGYALAHPSVTDWMNRLRQPFNVSQLALIAATAALDDQDFVRDSRKNNTEQRALLEQSLQNLGLSTISSQGNFIAFAVADGAKINGALLKQGVIVRPLASYGLPNHLRVTVGTVHENERFIKALAGILRG